MALVDTGLGWYADSAWLADTATAIGNITSEGEIVVYDPPDTNNYRLYYTAPHAPVVHTNYIECAVPGGILSSGISSTPLVHLSQGNVTYHCVYSYNGVMYDETATSYLPSSGDYYFYFGYRSYSTHNAFMCIAHSSGSGDIDTELKRSTTIISNCDIYYCSVTTGSGGPTITFAKSTAGYSVTCMCKWKAELGGDVYCSPVLISSVQNNTLYTRNSSTPSVPATEHTFSGMTFYMRKAPLDVVDGTETITANFPVLDYSSSPPITNDVLFALIAAASNLGVGPVPEDDPYSGGGESGPDAGDPTFDFTSEDIPVPGIPSIGAFNTGFINMYKPTVGDLRDLAHYLWSGSFDPENLRKLIANPMDAILGLHIVPATASHPAGSAATLYVGNIDTELSMLRLTEQYYELDCGTINIEPKWGAYLDYAPYSKLTLYLPYIGFVPISPDDCMGGSINVKYHVDVLSGACCVYVYCTSNRGEDSHVLYSYTGACACDCPVTEGQYTNAILGILNIAGSVAGAISSALTGNAGGVTGGIENAANAALSMVKPDISRSGSFGGSAGLMGIQYPYLVLTVPRMCTPGDQQKQEGYPSFVTKTMDELTGYNQVQVKRLEGMSCTANEAEEILTLLEGGAIF